VRKTLQQILAEYGTVALVVYLVIFFAVLFGFWTAIQMGWRESTAGSAGSFAAAYIATKLTQPLRIGATLLLTPIVARVLDRLRPRPRT
jgi:hypothetical protein